MISGPKFVERVELTIGRIVKQCGHPRSARAAAHQQLMVSEHEVIVNELSQEINRRCHARTHSLASSSCVHTQPYPLTAEVIARRDGGIRVVVVATSLALAAFGTAVRRTRRQAVTTSCGDEAVAGGQSRRGRLPRKAGIGLLVRTSRFPSRRLCWPTRLPLPAAGERQAGEPQGDHERQRRRFGHPRHGHRGQRDVERLVLARIEKVHPRCPEL